MSIQNITKHLTNPLILIFYSVLGSPVSYAHPGHQHDHSILLGSLLFITGLCALGLFVYRARTNGATVRESQ
ncbi:MAG TPA: hypothetical protein DCW74_11130 [Alteromonas australica]|uniref:Uncharacterized protein n=1 Tax=Alteromonas australica TaxID=589873 RepID=A0A350P4Q7_9ALTE|nr:hypothetical protein [Alteromonas australica]